MARRIALQAGTALIAVFAAGLVPGTPAHADPMSGSSSTVEMTMPEGGVDRDSAYQVPPVTLSEQDGTGGVDRDGTEGFINPDGTDGTITGPLMRATPAIDAPPAPSRRVRS